MNNFFAELKRRNVVRVAIAYAVVSWVILQFVDVIADPMSLPEWFQRVTIIFLTIGLPIALLLSWAYEVTPEGVKKTEEVDKSKSITHGTGQRINKLIIGSLVLAVGFLLYDKFYLSPEPQVEQEAKTEKSVAVLPFADLSQNQDQEWFSDGLTEEILNSLGRLPDLLVTARSSSFHFKGQDLQIANIAEQLGVAHIVEGSVRTDGDNLRVTAQLVRAGDGFQLWSETYDRPADSIFDVQEDIAEKIAVALDVFLDDAKRQLMFVGGTRNVEAFEAYRIGRELYDRGHRLNSQELQWQAAEYFKKAYSLDPEFAIAYGLHHDIYAHFLMKDTAANDPELTDEIALQIIRDDFRNAVLYAKDKRLRLATVLAESIFSDSWRLIPTQVEELEAFINTGAAEVRSAGWTHMLLVAMGKGDLLLRRSQNEIKYDPIDPLARSNLASAALAVGDYEGALEFVEEAHKVVPGHLFLTRTQALALALSGKPREGGEVFITRPDASVSFGYALMGLDEEARALAKEEEAARYLDPIPAWTYAELGDQAEVTRLTKIYDKSPLGALLFLRLIYYSGGFAPFDMDAAPNFRRKLEEVGVDPKSLQPWKPLAHGEENE